MTVPRPPALQAARSLVAARFPSARQAWLGGSAASGSTTATSDLDITVLLDRTPVGRESLTHQGWPVELFVHTEESVRHFVTQDLQRRRPTMARLVAEAVPLLPGAGGASLRGYCVDVLAEGPPPLEPAELDALRYLLTDQLDDLAATPTGVDPLDQAVAVEVWRLATELHLAAAPSWHGGGKWLTRELLALDERRGTDLALRLAGALTVAHTGSTGPLSACADEVLDAVGGRLREGYQQAARLP